ncbi:MAG: CTB family bacteriocin [Calothrix sp. MO_192.B10]|nr:CTB family bacteriocin [Calothrix sp. MO_192.B10]
MLSNKSELFVEVSEEQQEVVAGGALGLTALDLASLVEETGFIAQGATVSRNGASAGGIMAGSKTSSLASALRTLFVL